MPETFFNAKEQESIIEAIKQAELATSGEIRVHIESTCEGDVYETALATFNRLGMQQTEQRNAVLFYIAYASKKFAIIGDEGIHNKVTQYFWDTEKEMMAAYFKKGEYAKGLIQAILDAGEKLKVHFPYQSNDLNELPNSLSFGDQ
ncbi:MAG: TPM domain-containing protein [Bacteroidia bacterium]|jgi:uncharacterized membrane protein|nr:TPM domain-containing protein [Bacteroidia bacterium]